MVMISADRMKSVLMAPATPLLFQMRRVDRFRLMMFVAGRLDQMNDLFRTLVTEIKTADHQQRRHQPGHKIVDQKRGRQQDHKLVEQRTARDLPDDRQLARRRQALHIGGRHGGVVDHDAKRF
jgi:hypothetical protein